MNLKDILKSYLVHIAVIIGFVALSFAYFSPIISGKSLTQMDDTHAKGTSHELVEYEKAHPGEHPMWTNSIFGGMPSYLINGSPSFNIFHTLQPYIRLFLPYTTVAIMFLLLVGFYLLMVSLRIHPVLGIAGAIGFAFASFNIIIISVGHITQAYAISFIPMVIAGVLMLFRKKYLAGGLLTLFSLGIEISFSHPQIAYYCFMIILIIFITKFIYAYREKEIKHFLIVSGIFVCAVALAFLPNIVNLWTTAEYGKYSIRGKTELAKNNEGKVSSGLDKDYALDWSYGVAETFTILVPHFQGGGGSIGFDENSKTFKELQNAGLQNAKQIAASIQAYWGDQPFTSGPVYYGAIICFLFVLGLFLVKGPAKWWLLIASVLSIMLAWGKHFEPLTDLFFYYFPAYNKFRTVTMTLVIANFTFPLLGFLALKQIFEGKFQKEEILKALRNSLIVVGGLLLLFILLAGALFNFTGPEDSTLISQLQSSKWPQESINSLLAAIHSDRESMLRADSFRSLIFILLSAGLIWGFVTQKIKTALFSWGLALLILVDLWSVDKRYLNNDNFVEKTEYQNQFVPSQADEYILRDKDPDYRVLNISRNPFSDAYTPYFHKSIGGYHGAKMRRYQDLIDGPLMMNLKQIEGIFQGQPTPESINAGFKKLSILNMLNTKYIIFNPQANPLINPSALGNVWFVKDIKWVNNADEELAAVSNFDPAHTAVIDKHFEFLGNGVTPQNDSTATIKLISYAPADLVYQSNSKTQQLAVFSEVYYEKGWDAYIDGKLTPHGRADYILRALVIPAGDHKIEFKFEPRSYSMGREIAMISSIVVILVTIVGLFFVFKSFGEKK